MKKIDAKENFELFKKLPLKLQELLFDDGVSVEIEKICRKNYLTESFDEILTIVADVLLGKTSPEEIQKTLIRDAGIDISKSKIIANEIVLSLLFPVKTELLDVYKEKSPNLVSFFKNFQQDKESSNENSLPKSAQDSYRESIE